MTLTDDQLREVVSWLSPLTPWDDHAIAISTHEDGTSSWLIKSREFQDWINGSHPILWLSGPSTLSEKLDCDSKQGTRLLTCAQQWGEARQCYCKHPCHITHRRIVVATRVSSEIPI